MTAEPLGSRTDASLWQRRYLDLGDFIRRTGRLPAAQTDERAEYRLYRWVEVQRVQAISGALSPALVQQLTSLVPDLSDQGRSTPTWMTRYDDLAAFVNGNGRLPTFTHSRDAGEDRLALWWHRQLNTGADTLSAEQRRLLDVLPVNYAQQNTTPPRPV